MTLRIISGQQLPKPEKGSKEGEVIDPYVLVQFFGVAQDKAEYRTKFVSDNGERYTILYYSGQCLYHSMIMDRDIIYTLDKFCVRLSG